MKTLRYLPGTDLRDRKHAFTLVHAETLAEAEAAREAVPEPWRSMLEVVER